MNIKINKKMTGIIILVIGICLGTIGIALIKDANTDKVNVDLKTKDVIVVNSLKSSTIEAVKSRTNIKSEKLIKRQNQGNKILKLDNTIKEKGNDFEKYIVQKFSTEHYTLLEWAGDKYVNGIYAETTKQPDLKFKTIEGKDSKYFAVECKYRTAFHDNEIQWCYDKQIENYKKYSTDKNIDVFIAIGIGGTPNSPNELFIVPLNDIHFIFLTKKFLNKYIKHNKEKNFFFDSSTNDLR